MPDVLKHDEMVARPLSRELSSKLAEIVPGGVDSPFRAFTEVGGHTIFFDRGQGAYLWDVDHNRYIDYLGAWGPVVLGHCPPPVVAACQNAISNGPVFGAPHESELLLAAALSKAVPSMEQIRFVNSGTEAVMSAVRLSRGFTGRDLIITFEGCYHGHSDSVLASREHRSSSGIPQAVANNTLRVRFNDLTALKECLSANRNQIAAVLIEPVAGSMGVIPPQPGYLDGVRMLCSRYDCLLIFDEVLTGFRVAYGGAQELYGVKPDLSCFGKALGGGMPIGAYGGRKEIMDRLQPLGDVYQAGTFSGNPVTMAGGIETLRLLGQPGIYGTLEERVTQLFDGLNSAVDRLHAPIQLQRAGSMFGILFALQEVKNYQDSLTIDLHAYSRFFHQVLNRGIYFPPSAVDAACLSSAHSPEDIDDTIRLCFEALR